MKITLSERTKTILRRAVLYPLWFMFCFLTFAYCTFPYDRVRDRIESEVERAMPGSDLEIVSLSPSWVTGVELEGVSLTLPAEEEGERPTQLALTNVHARVGMLSSLFGNTSISYSAELGGGGSVEGAFANSETETELQMHLEEVALGRIGPLRQYVKLPLTGTMSGSFTY